MIFPLIFCQLMLLSTSVSGRGISSAQLNKLIAFMKDFRIDLVRLSEEKDKIKIITDFP